MTDAERAAWNWQTRPASDVAKLSQLLTRWRADPVAFSFDGPRYSLMHYQAQALLDLADAPAEVYAFYGLDPHFPKGKVLLPSGHGLGKTTVCALAIWWHKLTHKFSKQLVTAPTADQLTGGLMGEVRKIWRQLDIRWPMLTADWEVQGSGIVHKDPRYKDWQTQLRTARPDKPEALQGSHALDAIDPFGDLASVWGDSPARTPSGGMLIVIEEASGVDDAIRKTLEGSLSEHGARLLAPGNPTRADGWFAEDIDRPDAYAVHHLDCRMSDINSVYSLPYRPPRFGAATVPIRTHGFVTRKYWQDILAECDGDEEADYFRVRVRGLKPVSNVRQVLRSEWVDEAMARGQHPDTKALPVVLGADFGLMADKHALAAVQGVAVLDLDEWLIPSLPDTQLESAFHRIVEWQTLYGARIIVGDSNGVGAGVMSRLTAYYNAPERRSLHVRVVHFNSGMVARDATRYGRLRDEMWYRHGRALLADPRCSLPPKPGLRSQLIAPGFAEDERNVIRLETKKETKKRTGQDSGNGADAILMTQMVNALPPAAERPADTVPDLHPSLAKHFKRLRAVSAQGELIR